MHKPELLYFDNVNYQTEMGHLELSKNKLQGILDCYKTLGLATLTTQEFHQLFQNPDDLLFDKITQAQGSGFGLGRIIKKKALEMLEKPAGYEDFLQKVSGYGAESQAAYLRSQANCPVESFEIVKDAITIKSEVTESLKNSNTYFTQNQRQNDVLGALKIILEAVQVLNFGDSGFYHNESLAADLAKFITGNAQTGFLVNYHQVRALQ